MDDSRGEVCWEVALSLSLSVRAGAGNNTTAAPAHTRLVSPGPLGGRARIKSTIQTIWREDGH